MKPKSSSIAVAVCIVVLGFTGSQSRSQSQPPKVAPLQGTPSSADIQKKIEEYIRFSFALGPTVKLTFSPLTESPVPGLYKVTVEVSTPDNPSDKATFYVSKDGRYLVRADLEDMNADPFAENRKLISLVGTPSKGPANAKVVIVEYADFECPSCKQLDTVLRSLLPQYPDVRFLFKNFPLSDIHPWAMTAAQAGQCAYKQNPEAFWTFHDLVFDGQGFVSADNILQKMADYATQAGLDPIAMRSCITNQQAKEEVGKSIAEGEALHIMQTPTIFVNGRRLIAPDAATLDQYIRYEQAIRSVAKTQY